MIDTATSRVLARPSLTGAGLSSIATARGLAYAINTATHELAVLDPGAQTTATYALAQEPAAVAASEDTGAVYVLSSRASMILRLDPSDGSEIGRAVLPDRSGHTGLVPQNTLAMRPRLAINQTAETVFATLPEAGALAAVGTDQYPVIAREIPWPDATGIAVAAEVPEVLSPASARSGSAQAPATSH